MATHAVILKRNVDQVHLHIAEAAVRSGRGREDITLVAVTKYVDTEITAALVDAGCTTLGESRPQTLWQKAAELASRSSVSQSIAWHMIGHLQRNKLRRTLPLLACIHSVDSLRLLDSLQQEALHAEHRLSVLLEVNISGESEKSGFSPEALQALSPKLHQWDAINLCGLMAMSGRHSDLETARRQFAQVRCLRDRMQDECAESVRLQHLSMGMSGDYEVAIEEGATIVRVGSALFEGVRQ